jgi:polar amino acid transport system permease protein
MGFDLRYVVEPLPRLIGAAGVTLKTSVLAIPLALVVGLCLTIARQFRFAALHYACSLYISLMRGTPLLLQILVVFYGLTSFGLDVPPFLAGVIALSLNSGAYVTEIVRGGLSAIPRGQVEAARALGMWTPLIWRRIIVPQLFFLILPPLTMEFTGLLKASALLSVITVVELTRTAQQIIGVTFRPVEAWVATAGIYFIMCFALAQVAARFERVAAVYRP